MYCVCYYFSINTGVPDYEEKFVKCWTAFSDFFKRKAGALDSHLHCTGEGEYSAIAYWPDLETYTASRELTPDEAFMKLRFEWAELVEGTEVIFEGAQIKTV